MNLIVNGKEVKFEDRMAMAVIIRRSFDLRAKSLDDVSSRHHATLFVNKRHTICHILFPGEDEVWIRCTISPRLKHVSDRYLRCYLYARFAKYIGVPV